MGCGGLVPDADLGVLVAGEDHSFAEGDGFGGA